MLPPPQAFFVTSPRGGQHSQRFVLWQAPLQEPLGLVVHVHALTEEMNKSRRMVALQSRSFAQAGFAVLQMDRLGCGDSAGDSGDAQWADWLDDVLQACTLARQLAGKHWPLIGCPPVWLWGLRSGCLLAAEAAARMPERPNLLFWQPVLRGSTALQQLFRLDNVASRMHKEQPRPSAKQLFAAGQHFTVAGYDIHPALAQGLQAAQLLPVPGVPRMVWLDVVSQPLAESSAQSVDARRAWNAIIPDLHHATVIGPAFWQTTEVEDAPALITGTTRSLQLHAAAVAEAA